jgi:hypothetical protein
MGTDVCPLHRAGRFVRIEWCFPRARCNPSLLGGVDLETDAGGYDSERLALVGKSHEVQAVVEGELAILVDAAGLWIGLRRGWCGWSAGTRERRFGRWLGIEMFAGESFLGAVGQADRPGIRAALDGKGLADPGDADIVAVGLKRQAATVIHLAG